MDEQTQKWLHQFIETEFQNRSVPTQSHLIDLFSIYCDKDTDPLTRDLTCRDIVESIWYFMFP